MRYRVISAGAHWVPCEKKVCGSARSGGENRRERKRNPIGSSRHSGEVEVGERGPSAKEEFTQKKDSGGAGQEKKSHSTTKKGLSESAARKKLKRGGENEEGKGTVGSLSFAQIPKGKE